MKFFDLKGYVSIVNKNRIMILNLNPIQFERI